MPRKAKVDAAVENESVQSIEEATQETQSLEVALNVSENPASEPVSDSAPEPAPEPKPKRKPRAKKQSDPDPTVESGEPPEESVTLPEKPPSELPPAARAAFYDLNFNKLDRDLSPDEQWEWNAIYASYRAGSILTGRVVGVDDIRVGDQTVTCLVVFDYRVKILIPHTEVWADEASAKPVRVLQRYLGAEVDYIIQEVDREGNCAVASRKLALRHRRKSFRKKMPEIGSLVDCRIQAVSPTRMQVECGGYDVTLPQKAISYGTILDLREDYHPGQVIKAVFKGLDEDRLKLSVKEVNPHPFDNVETRHPLHCRRVSRIMGKYAGGVFCEMEKGFTCLCLYSPEQKDENFDPGDNVIIVVTRYDYANKLVYGKIVTAW